MPAIGAPSRAHLRKAYTIAAVIAGIAGAVLTHTTSTVSLETLSFGRSADVLVILILGGAGRLYGGIIGAIIYMVARDQFSGVNPQYWYFWIGLLLVAVVMFLPNGILGGFQNSLNARSLNKRFGSLVVAQDIALELPQGERHALIGPNGAGKTTLINLMTGMLAPDAGQILLGGEDITAPAAATRVKRGLARTFQINTLFPQLTALESVTLAVLRARRPRAQLVARPAALRRRDRRSATRFWQSLKFCNAPSGTTRELAYGQQRLLEIALALATRPQGAAARRARGRRAEGRERASCSPPSPACRSELTRAVHRARHGRGVPLRQPHHRDGRRPHPGRRHAGRDRARRARARGLSWKAPWLRCLS